MAKSIPKQIKKEVLDIVDVFNQSHQTNFHISFRASFAYLSKKEPNKSQQFLNILAKAMGQKLPKQNKGQDQWIETKIGRLAWKESMKDWAFAVYKYSKDAYDPNEWMFPGAEELDGTIKGALRAAIHIYP